MRRVAGGILIGIVVAGLAGGGAIATNDPIASDAWQGIPPIGLGAVFVYVDSDSAEHRYVFEDGGQLVGADGQLHDSLRVNGGLYVTGEIAFLQREAGQGSGSSGSGGVRSSTASMTYDLAGRHWLPCGMETSVRSHVDAPAEIHVAGACLVDGGPATFALERRANFLGRAAAVYTPVGAANVEEMWYASGIAAPVKLVFASGVVWTLQAFEPGESWPANDPIPVFEPPAPSRQDRYGPQGSAGLLPVDLIQAVGIAQRDPQAREVTAFVAAHPDWTIRAAAGMVKKGPNWMDVSWRFTLQEGSDALDVRVYVTRDLVPGTAALEPSYWEETTVFSTEGRVRGDADRLMPAWTDIRDAWSAMVGPDRPVTDVAFDLAPEFSQAVVQLGDGPLAQWGTSGTQLGSMREPHAGAEEGLLIGFDSKGQMVRRTTSVTTHGEDDAAGGMQPAAVRHEAQTIDWLSPVVVGSAGGAGLAAAVLYVLWPLLKQGVGVGLFSRLAPSDVSDHPRRQRILEVVRERPGLHYRQLGRRAGFSNGALDHHLGILVANGKLVRERRGNHTCYTLPGVAAGQRPTSAGAKAIVASIKRHPGITPSEVAEATALSEGTVSYHLRRMEASGAIESQYADGRRHLQLAA